MDIETPYRENSSEDPFKICRGYLDYPPSVYIISKRWQKKFRESLSSMENCIKKLEDGKDIKEFNFKVIEECINLLTSLIYQKEEDERLKKFMASYIFIAYNVNNNTFKYAQVIRKIEYIQRYTDNCLTFSESLKILKEVGKRLSSWKKWLPPSFKLSDHYYNIFKED